MNIKGGWSRLPARSTGFIGILALLGILSMGSAPSASALPVFNGLTSFSTIHGPSDPEEFSWEIELAENQALELIDDQHVLVYYTESHHLAFTITPEPAHDANGTTVPTSLGVSGANIITLTVHHRAGNPAAGGAPFDYPVVAGNGWEGGYTTHIVSGPPDEQQLREEREKRQREEWEAALRQEALTGCRVPGLKGASLKASRKRLDKASCKLGKVRGERSRTAKVVKQDLPPGKVLPAGTGVSVKIGG